MKPTLGVIITNYNTPTLTNACVDACIRWCGADMTEAFIIDDASTKELPSAPAPFRLIQNETNLGLVKSLNRAMGFISTEVVTLFDSDALPLNRFAPVLQKRFADDPHLGLIGFATQSRDGRPTACSCKEPDAASIILGQALDSYYDKWFRREKYPCVFACAMAVRRKAAEDVGFFDEAFDWIDFDIEFAMRLRRAGWKVELEPLVTAIHEGFGTPQSETERVKRHYKNRWYLLSKHNKIKAKLLVKAVVILRLRMEALLFQFSARRGDNSLTNTQKARGRRDIIDMMRHSFK